MRRPDGSRVRVQQDVAGNCKTPALVAVTIDGVDMRDAEFVARCRSCPQCVRAHRAFWAMRCQAEMLYAGVNYMFTGTFADQTDDVGVVGDECTRFLKRLRRRMERGGAGRLRYLLVFEKHKTGMLHVHAILHGNSRAIGVLADRCWTAGFSYTRWCDLGAAGYVTKYVTKDLSDGTKGGKPRIRASRNPTYGGVIVQRDKELVRSLLATKEKELTVETWNKNLRMLMEEYRQKQSKEKDLLSRLTSGLQG